MSETVIDQITQSWITTTLRMYQDYIAELEPVNVVELVERRIAETLEDAQKAGASEAQWEEAANVMVGLNSIIPGVQRDEETGEVTRVVS